MQILTMMDGLYVQTAASGLVKIKRIPWHKTTDYMLAQVAVTEEQAIENYKHKYGRTPKIISVLKQITGDVIYLGE